MTMYQEGTLSAPQVSALVSEHMEKLIRFHEAQIMPGSNEEDVEMHERQIMRLQQEFSEMKGLLKAD